jgi:hypothetical protein
MSAMDDSSNAAEEDSIWLSAESAKQIQKLGQVEQVSNTNPVFMAINDDIKKKK